jgi:hypothetical protein
MFIRYEYTCYGLERTNHGKKAHQKYAKGDIFIVLVHLENYCISKFEKSTITSIPQKILFDSKRISTDQPSTIPTC